MHTGVKNHECQLCAKTSTYKGALTASPYTQFYCTLVLGIMNGKWWVVGHLHIALCTGASTHFYVFLHSVNFQFHPASDFLMWLMS